MQHFDMLKNFIYKISVSLMLLTTLVLQVQAQVFPVDTLVNNGVRSNRINLVYMSDGYQAAQLPTFITDASTVNNALFGQTPFQEYALYFNAYAISVPSAQAGAIHPGNASDEGTSGGQPIANPNIYFQSTFDYFSIHRLLVPQNSTAIYNVLASNLPEYDQPFLIVNSPYYGGSGGSFATTSTHSSATEIAIHEIGHSFAGLADEYWAGEVYAAEKPNLTKDNNASTNKWKSWLGISAVGIYPHEENPVWFRPHQNCKMRYLGFPFCAVCRERFIDRIHQLVNMVDSYTPASTSFTLTNVNPVDLTVSAVMTVPSTITINWYLNGATTPFATGQAAVSIPYASFITGNNTVRAEVVDNTSLSKTYLPGMGYVNSISWTINNPSTLPVRLKSFSGKTDGKKGTLNWEIDSPDDLQGFELEKSKDGAKFLKLSSIQRANNTSSYSYDDPVLFTANTFYRLKIIEKTGKSFYSNTIRLQTPFDKYFYKVYQDAAQRQYHLSLGTTSPQKIAIQVLDLSGRLVTQKDFGIVNGQLDKDFDLVGKPSGIYMLSVSIDDKKYAVQLIAK